MRGIAILAVAGLALVASGTASAQQGVIMGNMITASGTVEQIDNANRQVTLKGADGGLVTVEVSKEAKRFDELKVGDTVTISYADAVVVRLKKPDEISVNTLEAEKGAGERESPGGSEVVKRTMTATIEALDPSVPSVTFAGPGGSKYTRRIRDPEVLEQVKAGKIKVGDRVDFTWYLATDITVKAGTGSLTAGRSAEGTKGMIFYDAALFEFGKAALTPAGKEKIREYRDQAKEALDRAETVRITGYTDNVGEPAYNSTLSLQRAEAVRDSLISLGADPKKCQVSGAGEAKPIGDNSTEEGRAQNRRVEVEVIGVGR